MGKIVYTFQKVGITIFLQDIKNFTYKCLSYHGSTVYYVKNYELLI